MALQVIGAGLGRTGTTTLAKALEQLGIAPCYTIRDVDKNEGHLDLWLTAMADDAIEWDSIYGAYQAAVDWPTVSFLPHLVDYYPDAKFVLTMRDAASWYESASQTIFKALPMSGGNPDPKRKRSMEMKRRLILDRMFDGKYDDKAHCIQVFKAHIQQVLDTIPEHRLLQFHLADGWQPLCDFLGKPAPDNPFPHVNDRASFLAEAPDWAKKMMSEDNEESVS